MYDFLLPVTPKPHETFPPSNMPLGATEAPILRPAPLRKLYNKLSQSFEVREVLHLWW